MLRLFLLPLFLATTFTYAWSNEAHQAIDSSTLRRTLIDEVAVLVDRGGNETIDSVAVADESRFKPLTKTFSAGYTRDVHWLRIRLQREGSAQRNWLLEVSPAFLDDVRLYVPAPSAGHGFKEKRSGDHLPFSSRALAHRNFVFNFVFPEDAAVTVAYLRVQTSSTSIVQLTLWQERTFDRAAFGEYLALGILLGVLLLLLIYAITHCIYLKEKVFLLFVCQVFSMLLTSIANNGIAAQFFFPDAPLIADLLTPVGSCLINFFGYWFFIEFLDVRRRYPRASYLYLLTMLVSAITLPAAFLGYYVNLAPILMALSLLSILLCVFIAWQSIAYGALGARWIFAGYVWYSIAVGLNILSLLGTIPGEDFFLQGWQHSAPVFVIFLQQGILSRMRAREHLKEQAISQAKEAETRADLSNKQREAQGKFLSLMAHELKTPLAVIDAAVQALSYIQSDPAVNARHERIRSAVARLNALLEHSLNAMRDDPERLRLTMSQREVFVVSDLLKALATSIERPARTNMIFEPTSVEHCYGDRTLLDIALTNLLDNARKYAPTESSITVSATRRYHLGTSGIAFDFAHAYRGKHEEDLEAWFNKFCRGQNSEGKEGVGLGLYLVRMIAEAHDGTAFFTLNTNDSAAQLIMTFWIPERSSSGDAI